MLLRIPVVNGAAGFEALVGCRCFDSFGERESEERDVRLGEGEVASVRSGQEYCVTCLSLGDPDHPAPP